MIYFLILGMGVASWLSSWWSILLLAFAVGYYGRDLWSPLRQCALAGSIVWVAFAFYNDLRGQGLISGSMAEVMRVGHGAVVFLVTGLVGGVVAGLGALCGYTYRNIRNEKTPS